MVLISDGGRFVVVHPRFTVFTTLGDEVENTAKFGIFRPSGVTQGTDHTLPFLSFPFLSSPYSSVPNLARIGLGVWVQESSKIPKSIIFVWLCVVSLYTLSGKQVPLHL